MTGRERATVAIAVDVQDGRAVGLARRAGSSRAASGCSRSSGTVRLAARAACAATWPPKSRGRRTSPLGFRPRKMSRSSSSRSSTLQQLGDVAGLGFARASTASVVSSTPGTVDRRAAGRPRCLSCVGWRRSSDGPRRVRFARREFLLGRRPDRRRDRAGSVTCVRGVRAAVPLRARATQLAAHERARRHRVGRAVRHRRRRDDGEPLVRPPARLDGHRRRVPRRRSPALRRRLRHRRQPERRRTPTRRASRSRRTGCPGPPGEQFPYQGCGENIPGHGWNAGRVQMNDGFLAKGSGNGPFALGYYDAVRHALHRAARAALHHRRPLVLVAARPDVPEPPVPARRAVGAPEARPGSAEAGHVPHQDDLGQPPRRQGAVGLLLHRPADRDRCGASGSTASPTRSTTTSTTRRRASSPTS